jgi:tryptophan synthase alpha subunit
MHLRSQFLLHSSLLGVVKFRQGICRETSREHLERIRDLCDVHPVTGLGLARPDQLHAGQELRHFIRK